MKKYGSLLILVLMAVIGCSGENHNFRLAGKIPVYADRWYVLNNIPAGMDALFDGKTGSVNKNWGAVLKHYEAWYPLEEGEEMTIDSVMMYDGMGSNEDHPTTIYAISKDWKRTPVAVFTGASYEKWVGPDPANPGVFALPHKITGIRYLVIDTWGDFPEEIEFYGSYIAPGPFTPAVVKYVPLRNFFGVNAFEWDFEDGKDARRLDPNRLPAIKCFTSVRHYMDWEKLEPDEGSYTFNPVREGGWNYDTINTWCKSQGIEVLACLKTIPRWLQATYPESERDNENVPARYGSDLSDPASYREQARVAFQYAARYGYNKNADRTLQEVDAKPRWTNDPVNTVKTGMGLIRYIECDNERDKWWKGRKAYQTGREYAANLSAFYDGHKGKLGPGTGVKNADPSMKVVMAGLAMPATDYVRGIIDWSREFRGLKSDGTVDLPFDIINYHYYSSDADTGADHKQTTGIAPETGKSEAIAASFIEMAHKCAYDMPVWVTETGYDINAQSVQRAPAIAGKSALQTQADWILRTSLMYARSGIQRVFFYELDDDNSNNSTKYASSGLINVDKSRRPAADFLYQVNRLFGEFTFVENICKAPRVDKYVCNGKSIYSLVVPDQKGQTINYTLDLGQAATGYIYTPKAGSDHMDPEIRKTNRGKLTIRVGETPVFVTDYEVK